ncbi:hypothetical protein V8F06_013677 [Rhypophila decipiens]
MPGFGEPGCTIIQYPWEILEKWDKLQYLPRPEPPRHWSHAHKHWEREYAHWRDLKCKSQKGAYFCRRHGKWITCEELKAGWASSQSDELYGPDHHRCPQSHYDWEEAEERIFQAQREQVEALLLQSTAMEAPGNDEAALTTEPHQQLNSAFGELYISHSNEGGEVHADYSAYEYHYPNNEISPSYHSEVISDDVPYGSPSEALDASQYRDDRSGVLGYEDSRSTSKSKKVPKAITSKPSSRSHGITSGSSKSSGSKSQTPKHNTKSADSSNTGYPKANYSKADSSNASYPNANYSKANSSNARYANADYSRDSGSIEFSRTVDEKTIYQKDSRTDQKHVEERLKISRSNTNLHQSYQY